jgi:hypothetical protein
MSEVPHKHASKDPTPPSENVAFDPKSEKLIQQLT